MPDTRQLKVAIVGAGKVGTVLGRVLVEEGGRIVAVVSRTIRSAVTAGRYLRCRNSSTELSAIPPDTAIIYLTVPHAAVGEIARALAELPGRSFRRLAVCHASGMLTAEVLQPVRERGASVFSFHPLQTFPREFRPQDIVGTARGIYYGVDGDPRALRIARRLARALKGHVIEIPPQMRVLYHAACVLASNHLTAMLSLLDTMFQRIVPGERRFFPVFKPIIAATLANIEKTSPARALSGPVARGGVETVAQHFEAVRRWAPELVPYFAAMSLETVRLASAKGSIDEDRARALQDVITSQFHPFPNRKE
jgi:predicted short-subunit dehydrogenase-like oxidoreductase (DUF2520 family)